MLERQWADIYLPDLQSRDPLEARALFFIPNALTLSHRSGLRAGNLAAFAAAKFDTENLAERVGRSAITRVLHVLPVTYASAAGFLSLFNEALARRGFVGRLHHKDIIACIFQLKDAAEIARAYNVTAAEIAVGSGVPAPVVDAALGRYRLQYSDAHRLWTYFHALREIDDLNGQFEEVLTSDERDFLKTDVRGSLPPAVKKVNEDQYVYDWTNLAPASELDHHWARLVKPQDIAGR